ncbi:hypothetical protein [Cryptosporangium minutisporangium]|uniref:hypothetical protein n=1 Tax=Cryptosporangium minutisporangium TaxID=113569 RepID=UPI0031E5DEED
MEPSDVVATLLRNGRWNDAATYYPNVEDPSAVDHASLLLSAGRPAEAHALLTDHAADDEDEAWTGFVDQVDAVIGGDATRFPDLVTAAQNLWPSPLLLLLMLRAADAAGQPDTGTHYAKLLQEQLPGDVDAARVVAVGLVGDGNYAAAVHVIDRAELIRCIDEPDPLAATLDELIAAGDRASVRALVTIGRFMHRELDPTQPVTDADRAARQRWRIAYRNNAPHRWRRYAPHLVLFAVGAAIAITIGNGLPVVLVSVALGAWVRIRPLPGMDLRTSQIVRATADPLQALKSRTYRPIDVFTFILTLMAGIALVAQLPRLPHWVEPLETITVVAIAFAAARGRRRWVRYERQRLALPPPDPHTCRCLDTTALRGEGTRGYVFNHLFPVGTVPAAPRWQVLQCLQTHARYLDLPHAELTLRLPATPPRHRVPTHGP